MGCCASAPAPLEEGVPPEGADLFAELGVSLLDRPLGNELKEVWYLSDRNHNDVLEAAELAAFFEAVSSKWGGSKWTKGANATSAVDVFLEAQQGSVDWQCVVAPHACRCLSFHRVTTMPPTVSHQRWLTSGVCCPAL